MVNNNSYKITFLKTKNKIGTTGPEKVEKRPSLQKSETKTAWDAKSEMEMTRRQIFLGVAYKTQRLWD